MSSACRRPSRPDALHLFSIGEGIAYGSSVINYVVSGAPVSAFRIELSDEYANVEFTGKDMRNNWQKVNGVYVVQLNTPVSGAYTLLATYERPFKAQGETLSFTGARPLDAQSEQGTRSLPAPINSRSIRPTFHPACCRWKPPKCRRNTGCFSMRPSCAPIVTRRARLI